MPLSTRCTLPSISIRNVPRPVSTISPYSASEVTRSFGSRRSSMKMPSSWPSARRSRMWNVSPRSIDSEAARLHDVDDEIRLHLGRPVAQLAQAGRREIGAHAEDQQRDHDRGGQERPEDAPRRHAGCVHHDDFGIGVEPVQRVADRHHQGERRDHQHQHGDQQAGDADEHQDRLTLVGHQVDFAQRVRQPDDRRQADQDQQERAESCAENVAVERTHWPAVTPISRSAASPDALQKIPRGNRWQDRGSDLASYPPMGYWRAEFALFWCGNAIFRPSVTRKDQFPHGGFPETRLRSHRGAGRRRSDRVRR